MDSDPFRHTCDTILKRFIMFYLITIPPVSIVTFTGYSGIIPNVQGQLWNEQHIPFRLKELWHKINPGNRWRDLTNFCKI